MLTMLRLHTKVVNNVGLQLCKVCGFGLTYGHSIDVNNLNERAFVGCLFLREALLDSGDNVTLRMV